MTSEPIKVYLSGGMEYATGEGAGWRSELESWIRKELGHNVFNPNEESRKFLERTIPGQDMRSLKHLDQKTFSVVMRQIVAIDSSEIAERSDYVVCLWDESAQRGAGTKGELTIARLYCKPVFMVTVIPFIDIPSWVIGCAEIIFSSFEELKKFLLTEYGKCT